MPAIDDDVAFQAGSVADLAREFHVSVERYLAVCAAQGKQPNAPRAAPVSAHETDAAGMPEAPLKLEYRGYRAGVELDFDAGVLVGRVLDVEPVLTFAAERVDEIVYLSGHGCACCSCNHPVRCPSRGCDFDRRMRRGTGRIVCVKKGA